MKIILNAITLVVFLSNSTIIYAQVLYCSDDDAVGFQVSQNNKVTRFLGEKFKIKVDFNNRVLVSKELFFTDLTESRACVADNRERALYCINRYGTTFNINLNTMKYFKSTMFVAKGNTDTAAISYGTCENF